MHIQSGTKRAIHVNALLLSEIVKSVDYPPPYIWNFQYDLRKEGLIECLIRFRGINAVGPINGLRDELLSHFERTFENCGISDSAVGIERIRTQ